VTIIIMKPKLSSEMNKWNSIHYLNSITWHHPFRDNSFHKISADWTRNNILYPALAPSGISTIKDSLLVSLCTEADFIELFLARLRLFSAGNKSSTDK